ncbi:MAG: NAD-binding protein, partial [Marinobacter sp.]|nr:NAD-binding protein [Marinobacter sp.]
VGYAKNPHAKQCNGEKNKNNSAKALNLMGPAGSGQKTKMVNQIAVAGLVQALSEALHFAEQADLDVRKVVDVISKGAAQSWQMENRSETMIEGEFDHGFAV